MRAGSTGSLSARCCSAWRRVCRGSSQRCEACRRAECSARSTTGRGLSDSCFRLSSMSSECEREQGAGIGEQSVPLSDEQLANNFADIAPPLTTDAALLEANKCLFCHDAPCTIACPTHIDVPAFIKKIASGNLRGSARVILDANPFGHSCARACPVEVLCEGACVLNDRDEQPIKIALLQRHATDYVLEHKYQPFEAGKSNGKKVAIVGGGPAGLSCARDLRRFGYAVTIYDEREQLGGLNTYGIAEYKMRQPLA